MFWGVTPAQYRQLRRPFRNDHHQNQAVSCNSQGEGIGVLFHYRSTVQHCKCVDLKRITCVPLSHHCWAIFLEHPLWYSMPLYWMNAPSIMKRNLKCLLNVKKNCEWRTSTVHTRWGQTPSGVAHLSVDCSIKRMFVMSCLFEEGSAHRFSRATGFTVYHAAGGFNSDQIIVIPVFLLCGLLSKLCSFCVIVIKKHGGKELGQKIVCVRFLGSLKLILQLLIPKHK